MRDHPDKIDLELVGRCNEACVYCNWQDRPVRAVMAYERACELQDEIAGFRGIRTVGLHGVGEPTLHPRMRDIVRRGAEKGISQGFSTNCRLPVPDGLERLEDLEVCLAVPWVSKHWRKCVANAREYLGRGPVNRNVYVQIVCHETAQERYPDFMAAFLPHAGGNVTLFAKQPLTWPGMAPQKGFVPAPHPDVTVDAMETPRSIGDGCSMPEHYLLALADGRFAPCCVGHTADWGLPRDCSIGEAWRSERMEWIRQAHRARSQALLCGTCHLS